MTLPVSIERHGNVALVWIDHPPVNALSQTVRSGLLNAVEEVRQDANISAVVLIGKGKCFIAGADIKEFGRPPQSPLLPEVCAAIEALSVPVIASLHGATLGGGLEVAMAAHYRLASPDAALGLPEVRLGLIPGAGGTQRLPRLIGTAPAIDMITTGRPLAALKAQAAGLVDRIVEDDLATASVGFARDLITSNAGARPTSALPSPDGLDWAKVTEAVSKRARGQIAPIKAVEAIKASTSLHFDAGVKAERRLFNDLMETNQRKALIHAFFAERRVSRLPEREDVDPRAFEHIGIVGGGTMGTGIATAALLADLSVSLVEQSVGKANDARARIEHNLEEAVRRGKVSSSEAHALITCKLSVSSSDDDLHAVDVLIEAVFEDLDAKIAVFERFDHICKPGALLATNTSYLDINRIAAATSRPQDVIGLHFFSPAHVMKLLEVIVPSTAMPDAVSTGFALARRLGKTAVRSGVCEGFIGNRILNACRTAVDHMVLDGASPFEVDAAMVDFGYPMGPFKVADLAGLDIGWAMRKRLAPLRKPHERVGTYADALCEAGHFGRKSGLGFYSYSTGQGEPTPNTEVLDFVAADRKSRGIVPAPFDAEGIQRRYMAAMVNEAARIVDEGVAQRPLDVDVVLIAGYGFPRYLGGPCKWADLEGLDGVLADIQHLAKTDSHFWVPAPLLERLVRQGGTFDDLN